MMVLVALVAMMMVGLAVMVLAGMVAVSLALVGLVLADGLRTVLAAILSGCRQGTLGIRRCLLVILAIRRILGGTLGLSAGNFLGRGHAPMLVEAVRSLRRVLVGDALAVGVLVGWRGRTGARCRLSAA
jgi:hypothetical protein